MLIGTPFGHFGAIDTAPMTPAEETRFPGYVSILQQLVNAENALQRAYTNISTLVQAAGPDSTLPVKLLVEYNAARKKLLLAAADWMKARAETPDEFLQDAGKVPEAPPAFVLPTPAISGLGEAVVSARSVQVVYGPAGAPQSIPLGHAEAPHIWPQRMNMSGVGLGNPALIVIIVLGVAVVGMTIALVIREWKRAQVMANSSRARESEANARATEAASEALLGLYLACVGDSTNEAHKLTCLENAQKATKDVIDALPKVPPTKAGLGFLGTIGLILLAAAAGVGGYLYWQKRKEEGRPFLPRARARR